MKRLSLSQNGFLMPTVVVMMGVCVALLITIFQYVVTVANLGSGVVYRQVALTGAKTALDYGKEQFDNNVNYAGTAETTLFTNATYKVTYQLEVVSTSADTRTKNVRGTGKVYIPASASTPRFERAINGEIIRSVIVSHTPSDFSPMAWYDASCNDATSADVGCNIDHVLSSTAATPVGLNPTSTREERSDGTFCNGAPNTGDNNLALTNAGECGASPTQQWVGFTFNAGASIPAGSGVNNAFVQMTAFQNNSGNMTYEIRGIDSNNVANFTNAAGSQLVSAPLTTASVTWTVTSAWSTNQVVQTPDISSIIQEIVNRPGWAQGNNIGLIIRRTSGSATRKVKPTPITLNVTLNNYTPANTAGNNVQTWKDRSGNGFHLNAINTANPPKKGAIAQAPTTSALYNKPMIVVDTATNGFKATIPGSSGRTSAAYTVFTVMRVLDGTYGDTSGDTDGGTLVGFFHATGTANAEIIPLWRHPYLGFHAYDSGTSADPNNICITRQTTERMCKTWSGNISTSALTYWKMYSAREGSQERDMLLRRNGNNSNFGQPQFYTAIQLNAPYDLTVGSDAKSWATTARAQADFAEVVIYDHALTCPQVEAVEQYLADKWGLSDPLTNSTSRYSSEGCTENSIPAY